MSVAVGDRPPFETSARPRGPPRARGRGSRCRRGACNSNSQLRIRNYLRAACERGSGPRIRCSGPPAVRLACFTYLHTIVSTRRVASNFTQDTTRLPRGPDAARRAVRSTIATLHPRRRVVASGPSLAGRTLQVTVLQSHTPPRHTLPTAHNTKIPPAPVAARPSSERAGRSA